MGFGRRRGVVSEEEEVAVAVAMDGSGSSRGVLGGGGFGLLALPSYPRGEKSGNWVIREERVPESLGKVKAWAW